MVPSILKFDHPLKLMIILDLAFGAICMFFLHVVRLSHGGKVCSGDFLENQDLKSSDGYLLERGWLLWFYIRAFWIGFGMFILVLIVIVILLIKSLK